MKTILVNELEGVQFTGGTSHRFILEKDNLGFAMMQTRIKKGGAYKWHYKNHQEVCYCISGEGTVKDLTNNECSVITSGVAYVVDKHQPHEFTAHTDVVLISVFNPPLKGNESHDENGNYNI